MGETVPPIPQDGPPDRENEIDTIKLEISKIEEMLKLHSAQRKEKGKGTEVRTVPPYFGLKISSKRKGKTSAGRKRKEIELCGENEEFRIQKKAMNRMFMSGKLRRGAVPPSPVIVTVPPSSACKQEAPTYHTW